MWPIRCDTSPQPEMSRRGDGHLSGLRKEKFPPSRSRRLILAGITYRVEEHSTWTLQRVGGGAFPEKPVVFVRQGFGPVPFPVGKAVVCKKARNIKGLVGVHYILHNHRIVAQSINLLNAR